MYIYLKWYRSPEFFFEILVQAKEVRWGRSLHAWACRRRPSVSYPSLRSRRIAGTIKGVTKFLSWFLCSLRYRRFSKVFETLAFDFILLLLLLMKKIWSWSYILCRRLRFELRSVDRLSLAHSGLVRKFKII